MALSHSSGSFSSYHMCLHKSCIASCNLSPHHLMSSAGIPSCSGDFQFFSCFIAFTVSLKVISSSFDFALCSFHSAPGVWHVVKTLSIHVIQMLYLETYKFVLPFKIKCHGTRCINLNNTNTSI